MLVEKDKELQEMKDWTRSESNPLLNLLFNSVDVSGCDISDVSTAHITCCYSWMLKYVTASNCM